ncbi:MAG: hypothetical protein A2075_16700 [Geobacteraceae bacterium GWC2_58_44]|nr:MAG: hypothetical protein A2075_16700 [Geobacteraceae bacterium GWC2_58_44]HBG06763.1 hypothetical protein [Geobacter sp.]
MSALTDGKEVVENPWLGLLPYEEKDHSRFFGRSAAVADLLRIVRRNSLAVVYGVSGIGKTSLLRAGLFPLLRSEGFLPVRLCPDFKDPGLAPGRQVIDAVEKEIARLGYDHDPLADPFGPEQETLWEYFHRLRFWNGVYPLTPLLVFDQFEEIFTHGASDAASRERAASFVIELGDLVENQLPLQVRRRMKQTQKIPLFPYETQNFKVLIALREDYLPNLERLVPQIPSLSTPDRYSLRAMNGNEAMEAVLGPGKELVERGVAEHMVLWASALQKGGAPGTAAAAESDVSLADLAVEPFLLSLFCRELCARMQREALPAITHELVSAHQAVIIDQFYEERFQGLSQQIRIFVEEELVGQSGYREMVAMEKADRCGIARQEWQALEQGRLVRIEDDRHGTRRIELIHDRLTDVVRQRREARHQEEARAQEEARRKEIEARRSARYRQKQITLLIGILLPLIVILSLIMIRVEKKSTIRAQQIADAARLATLAGTKLRGAEAERRLGLEMAVCAAALYKSAEGKVPPDMEEILRRAYLASTTPRRATSGGEPTGFAVSAAPVPIVATATNPITLWKVPEGSDKSTIMNNISSVYARLPKTISEPLSISFSPDGRFLASGGQDGIVQITELRTGERRRPPAGDGDGNPVQELVYSPDGSSIATGRGDGSLIVHDAQSLRETRFAVLGHDIKAMAFCPTDSALLAVADDSGTVSLWDIRDSARKTATKSFSAPRAQFTAVAFSPSGKSVAAAGSDGIIYIWDLAADRPAGPQHLGPKAPPIASISFCKKDDLIAGAYADNMVRIWSISGKKVITIVPSFPDLPKKIAFLDKRSGVSMILLDSKGKLKLINLSEISIEPDLDIVTEKAKDFLKQKKPVCPDKWEDPDQWAKCLAERSRGSASQRR